VPVAINGSVDPRFAPATSAPAAFTLTAEPVTDADSVLLLREYSAEMVTRHNGEPATDELVDRVMAEYPNDHLAAPTGVFLVLRTADGTPAGCAGIRLPGGGVGELTRFYLRPAHRGTGEGARLLHDVEEIARGLGVHTIRLDTRTDLTEARNLYARSGYREVPPPANPGRHQDHFFGKTL
jgi:GNAT superfamily N-acetyltransferase